MLIDRLDAMHLDVRVAAVEPDVGHELGLERELIVAGRDAGGRSVAGLDPLRCHDEEAKGHQHQADRRADTRFHSLALPGLEPLSSLFGCKVGWPAGVCI